MSRAALRLRELDEVAKREGERAHWHLRKLALSSHAWVWAELRRAPAKPRKAARAALISAHEAALRYGKESVADLDAIEGGKAYLEKAGAVLEIAKEEKLGRAAISDALERHNQSVTAFNAMIL